MNSNKKLAKSNLVEGGRVAQLGWLFYLNLSFGYEISLTSDS
jgi:hypothetical protein